jgi:hypothetical protein
VPGPSHPTLKPHKTLQGGSNVPISQMLETQRALEHSGEAGF